MAKEEPMIQMGGIGCLAFMVIALAVIGAFVFQDYQRNQADMECIKRGGKMVQTNKWYESHQMNCIGGSL